MTSQESDEEYLDDPIQLIELEQKRIAEAVKSYNALNSDPVIELTDSDGDLYIEKKNFTKKCWPQLKNVSITLPVTFFEIPRNVEQLNECKPLSVKLVNCVEHPWYYKKYLNKYVDTDKEVDFYTKEDKSSKKDTMNDDGKKITIRPVSSPYENLILESHKALSPQNVKQIDFKKNQGLIGMKITQTDESQTKVPQNTKLNVTKTLGKSKSEQKNRSKTNVKEHKNKTETSTSDSKISKNENIPKIDLTIEKDDDVVEKKNRDDENKMDRILQVQDRDNLPNREANQVKNSTKVKDIEGKIVQNSTDIPSKLNTALKNNKVIQNTVKVADKLIIDKDRKCYTNRKFVGLKVKKILDDRSNDIDQSLCLSGGHNTQKPTINEEKQKATKTNPTKLFGSDITIGKVTKKDCLTEILEKSKDKKTTDFGGILLNAQHGIKVVKSEEKNNKIKESPKKCSDNTGTTTSNNNLKSEPLTITNNTARQNNILNMKLVKPKKDTLKKRDITKVANNQKDLKKHDCSVKVAKDLISVDIQKKSANTGYDNNIKLLTDKIVMNSNVGKDNKSNANILPQSKQSKTSVLPAEKSIDYPNATNVCTPTSNNKQTSSYYVDTFAKIMGLNPEHNSNNTTVSQVTKHPGIYQNIPTLETSVVNNAKTNNNVTVHKNKPLPDNRLSSNDLSTKIKQKKQNIPDTVNRNIKNVQAKQKLPENINLNTKVLAITSVPHTMQNLNYNATIQSGMSAGNSNNTPLVSNQPIAFSNSNITTGTYLQIPLNISPSQNRCARVLKMSKKNYENKVIGNATSVLNFNNGMDKKKTAVDSNKIMSNQLNQCTDDNLTQNRSIPTLERSKDNITRYELVPSQHNLEASNSKMLSHFHTAAQQISRQSVLQQSVMSHQQNSSEQWQPPTNAQQIMQQSALQQSFMSNRQSTGEKASRQQPLSNAQHIMQQSVVQQQNMSNQQILGEKVAQQQPSTNSQQIIQQKSQSSQNNTTQQVSWQPPYSIAKQIIQQSVLQQKSQPIQNNTMQQVSQLHPSNVQQTIQQTNQSNTYQQFPHQLLPSNAQQIMQPTATANIQTGNHLRAVDPYTTLQEVLPPTCDVAVARTLPRQNLTTQNNLLQPQQQPVKRNIRSIILRPVGPKLRNTKQQIQLNATSQLDSSQNSFNHVMNTQRNTTNFGINTLHNYYNYGVNTQHNVQPIDQGFQRHYADFSKIPPQNFIHCAPIYDSLPNNIVDPNPTYHENYWNNYYNLMMPPPPPPVQQLKPIVNQTSALSSQNNPISSTPKSGTGTIIGCNKTGPIRKINILAEATEASAKKTNATSLSQHLEPVQICQNKNESLAHGKNNTEQNTIEQTKTDESYKKISSDGKKNVDQLDKREIARNCQIVNSKREMLEELSKITTIDSSTPSPVKDLKRPPPKTDTIPENENLIKRPRPGPLSKKLKLIERVPSPKIQTSLVAHKGYSPPILPIPTYEKTLEILARSSAVDNKLSFSIENEGETFPTNVNNNSCDEKRDKSAKKISLDEYKKRVSKPEGKNETEVKNDLHVDRIKVEIKSENPEQDLGYDSDSTMKV